jgi:hypothetical protein
MKNNHPGESIFSRLEVTDVLTIAGLVIFGLIFAFGA